MRAGGEGGNTIPRVRGVLYYGETMKDIPFNPYIVGNPIKSREMFFGREDDFAFVARKVGEARSNQIVVLCGERRSGKTSILFQILDGRLGEGFLPVLIDMQMLAGIKGDADFFRAILKAGRAALSRGEAPPGPEASSGPEAPREAAVDADANGGVEQMFESFLAEVQARAPGRIVLFLLDEYELIEAKIRDGSLGESTIHYLAGIIESPFRVSFVFTGSTNLEDRKAEVWKSLLGKSIYRKISYLSKADTARLITEPLKDSVVYPRPLVDAITRLTGGQPFYTQVICQNMVDLLMEQGRGDPSEQDLERIVRDIVDNPLPQMIYSWNSLSEWNQVILASLASRLPEPEGWANRSAVHGFLLRNRVRIPFKRERISVLLEEAYHSEMLEKDEHDSYRFRMDLMRRWIGREHSIWKVAREAGLEFGSGRKRLVIAAAAAAVLAVAALTVFVVLPRIRPAQQTAAAVYSDIVFSANRGPWRLSIDGGTSLTSEGTRDGKTISVATLAAGDHDIVATPDAGEKLSMTVRITASGQRIPVEFAALSTARTSGKTSTAAGTQGAQASTQAAATTPQGAASSEGAPEGSSGTSTESSAGTEASDPGTGGSVAAAVVVEATEGDLVINSKPADAYVSIDGVATGMQTPFIEKVASGNHEITLAHEGYTSATITVTVEPGKQTRKDVTLEEAWAYLTFDVRPTAKIYLDDGTSPIVETPYTKPYKVRAGRHVLTIVNEALKVKETLEVTVDEGATQLVQKVLK
jgi:hypothetical protein